MSKKKQPVEPSSREARATARAKREAEAQQEAEQRQRVVQQADADGALLALQQGVADCATHLGMVLRTAELRDVESIAHIHGSFEKEMSLFEDMERETFDSLRCAF